jgi:hypothetical protein
LAALAEAYGYMDNRKEFEGLIQKTQAVFPVDEVYTYRLREVYDLARKTAIPIPK